MAGSVQLYAFGYFFDGLLAGATMHFWLSGLLNNCVFRITFTLFILARIDVKEGE